MCDKKACIPGALTNLQQANVCRYNYLLACSVVCVLKNELLGNVKISDDALEGGQGGARGLSLSYIKKL